ncbi:MAG: hypothetical protein RJB62_979, partial [Pseudomonadota bacterium]
MLHGDGERAVINGNARGRIKIDRPSRHLVERAQDRHAVNAVRVRYGVEQRVFALDIGLRCVLSGSRLRGHGRAFRRDFGNGSGRFLTAGHKARDKYNGQGRR